MSAQVDAAGAGLLTIDELATAVGLTVRTTRYYASLGLVPPPVRRGRMAYYDAVHRARLELVRALQDHGFTLQAIERYVATLPEGATVEDLALQRAMMTSWSPAPTDVLTRRQLEAKARRPLSDADLATLVDLGTVEPTDGGFVAMANLQVGIELLDLDLPAGSVGAAEAAIRRHMGALAEELTEILHAQVLEPYRREPRSPEDAERLERTVSRLRQLTLEAVVTGFQRAANVVIRRSLAVSVVEEVAQQPSRNPRGGD
jgi:DNA-binding transcriptional MerR regulator